MRRAIRTTVRICVEAFEPPGPVYEIGAFYPPGSAALSDLRPSFPDREFVGCDIRPGHGVDRIEDAHALTLGDATAGTVVLCEILEHLEDPDRAVAEAHRVLRDDGMLILSVPFNYRLHGFPSDYWRFTASGVHQLLRAFPAKLVCAVGPRLKPAFVFAAAARTAHPHFDEAAARFRLALDQTMERRRLRGVLSVLKERGRDFLGAALGRADICVNWFDPAMRGGYRRD